MNEARPCRTHGGIDPHWGVACLRVTAMRRLPGSGRCRLPHPSNRCPAADAMGAASPTVCAQARRRPRERRSGLARPASADGPGSKRCTGGGLGKGPCVAATARKGATTGSTAQHHTLERIDVRLHGAPTGARHAAPEREARNEAAFEEDGCRDPERGFGLAQGPGTDRPGRDDDPLSRHDLPRGRGREWRGGCGHSFSNRFSNRRSNP